MHAITTARGAGRGIITPTRMLRPIAMITGATTLALVVLSVAAPAPDRELIRSPAFISVDTFPPLPARVERVEHASATTVTAAAPAPTVSPAMEATAMATATRGAENRSATPGNPPAQMPPPTPTPTADPDGPPTPPVVEGESIEPGRYEEVTDNGFFFEYPTGASGSAAQFVRGENERVRFYAYAQCSPDGTECQVSVSLDNTSGLEIRFPDGLHIDVSVSRGDTIVRVPLDELAITHLAIGGSYTGAAPFNPLGPGTYAVGATVVIEL